MPDLKNNIYNLQLELDDNSILSNLFGVNDSNLKIIEKINNVKILYRGNKIKISGEKKSIFETKKTILNLCKEAKNGADIDEDKIYDTRSLVSLNIKEEKQMHFLLNVNISSIIKSLYCLRTSLKQYFYLFSVSDGS